MEILLVMASYLAKNFNNGLQDFVAGNQGILTAVNNILSLSETMMAQNDNNQYGNLKNYLFLSKI